MTPVNVHDGENRVTQTDRKEWRGKKMKIERGNNERAALMAAQVKWQRARKVGGEEERAARMGLTVELRRSKGAGADTEIAPSPAPSPPRPRAHITTVQALAAAGVSANA